MGISGSKSKLRKGGGRPEGWYKIDNAKWEEFSAQSGDSYIGFTFEGDRPGLDKPADIRLILGPTSGKRDVTKYVEVTPKGALRSVDQDNEYQLPENSAPGHFFASLSEAGVPDKTMDQLGDKPSVLNGLIIHVIQEPVLDGNGDPKKNDAGYDITNTIVDKLGKEKDLKEEGEGGGSSRRASRKDDDDEEEKDEPEEEEEDDEAPASRSRSRSRDDDDDEEEEEEAPRRRAGKR